MGHRFLQQNVLQKKLFVCQARWNCAVMLLGDPRCVETLAGGISAMNHWVVSTVLRRVNWDDHPRDGRKRTKTFWIFETTNRIATIFKSLPTRSSSLFDAWQHQCAARAIELYYSLPLAVQGHHLQRWPPQRTKFSGSELTKVANQRCWGRLPSL